MKGLSKTNKFKEIENTEDIIKDDTLSNLLEPDKSQKKTDLDVLKELFEMKDIETKTELSAQQVILFNQKRTLGKLLKWDSLNECLRDFMLLMVSKERKGRGEFVEGFKSEREQSLTRSGGGFFDGIRNRLGFQR